MSAGGAWADMMTGSAPLARPLLRWASMKTMMLLLGCASLVAVGIPDVARAATDDDCRQFHRECVDAQAAGDRDAGICKVERLECRPGAAPTALDRDSTSSAGRPSREPAATRAPRDQ